MCVASRRAAGGPLAFRADSKAAWYASANAMRLSRTVCHSREAEWEVASAMSRSSSERTLARGEGGGGGSGQEATHTHTWIAARDMQWFPADPRPGRRRGI